MSAIQKLETDMCRETTHRMSSWDGAQIFYRAWCPAGPADKALILFHRGHEHSARFRDMAPALTLPGMAVFAWDARGHGHSDGERGFAPSFAALVKDAETFVRHVSHVHGIPLENMVVLGNSVGSTLVATWVHDYAPPIRGMVLGTPALRVRLYAPFALAGLRLLQWLKPNAAITSYVKARMLTHDRDQAKLYDSDPLISRTISVRVLLGLHDAAARIIRNAASIRVPTLLLSAGADFVVRKSAQKKFFAHLGSPQKAMRVYPGFFHDIFHEKDRAEPIGAAREFVQALFAGALPMTAQAQKPCLKTRVLQCVRAPVMDAAFSFARLFMRSLGRLSDGVRVGFRSGFDSGPMLDYVYRNRSSGRTPLGRLFDRVYLNSPGWIGIRERKLILERQLAETIARCRAGGTVRLLDPATGGGRYIFDALAHMPGQKLELTLCDADAGSLMTARREATARGLTNVRFLERDALQAEPIAGVAPYDIVVVSGLYELVPSNAPVMRSLEGIARMVKPGGYLIYTNQPWHPQLAFIANVLTKANGERWVMRPRPQWEMDALVRGAGFERMAMDLDRQGIFTVAVAQRRNSWLTAGRAA
jgi:alpha-beta hydrolase superfamily lysophospholipase/SAM-dependent methyltransferase